MPVQYAQSMMDSTKHCRKKALLFDVSHMCGLSLRVRAPWKLLDDVTDVTFDPGERCSALSGEARGGRYQGHQTWKWIAEPLYEREGWNHRRFRYYQGHSSHSIDRLLFFTRR